MVISIKVWSGEKSCECGTSSACSEPIREKRAQSRREPHEVSELRSSWPKQEIEPCRAREE